MVDLNCMEFVYEETLPLHSEEIYSNVNQNPAETLIFNNLEYTECIDVIDEGRKLKKPNKMNKAKTENNKIPFNFVIECSHKNISKPVCKISEVNNDCIQHFKNNLSILKTKIDQDKFLISAM
jgi:hypothetical protein